MAQHNNDIFEEMRKQRENEKEEKHAQYVSRGIPEDIISTLESGKLKKEQVDQVVRLPWEKLNARPVIKEADAQELLDEKHVGLEDVKLRIMDYVYSDFRGGAALLLVGPPGVGKTSIAIQISDLGAYIENHLDKSPDEIKEYCHKSNRWSPVLGSPILHQNIIQDQYYANNVRIMKSITYDLADLKGLARMLELFQQESRDLERTIAEGITNTDFGIDAICDVLIENRVYINNENILRRKLIQKYIQFTQTKHGKQLVRLKAMYGVIEILLKKLFSFEDKALRKYISSCRKQTFASYDKIQDEFMKIINDLPDSLFSDCKTACSRIIGSIDTIPASK